LIVGGDIQTDLPYGIALGGSFQRDKRNTNSILPHHVRSWSLFIQETLEFKRLTMISGFRLDQHSMFGNTYNPRLTAVLQAREQLKLSANISRAFRSPTFSDLFTPHTCSSGICFKGNPQLQPETAWTYDIGTEWSMNPYFRIQTTAFFTRIRERIETTPTTALNLARAEISGIESEGHWKLGKIFSGHISYTFLRAIGQSQAGAPWLSLPQTPKHAINSSLTIKSPTGLTFTTRMQNIHNQFDKAGGNGIKIPSYTLWNLKLSQKILQAEIYFAINNLMNKHVTDSLTGSMFNPLPGRTMRGGLSIRFEN